MDRVIGEIRETNEFEKFKHLEFNRSIDQQHIKRLYKKIKEQGWVEGNFALVDKEFNVYDGQHRIIASQKANVPVIYVTLKNPSPYLVQSINTDKKNWKIIDSLKFYVMRGNEDYKKFQKFMERFNEFSPTECMMLVTNSNSSAKRYNFENGNFKVGDMTLAYKWGEYIMKFQKLFKYYNSSPFVRAIIKCLTNPLFDKDDFLQRVIKYPGDLQRCTKKEDYLKLFQEIYNKRKKQHQKIELYNRY